MIDLNLLPTQQQVSLKETEFQNRFFLAVWVCTLILAVDLGLYFLISQVYKARVSQLVASRTELTTQSERLSPVAVALRTVQEKSQGYTSVIGKRQDMVAVINEVRRLTGTDVELTDLKVGMGTISFSGRAADVVALNSFVNRVAQMNTDTHLTNVILKNLRLSVGTSYDFQLIADYKPTPV